MRLASSSRTERFKQGKALRHKTPREASHADLNGVSPPTFPPRKGTS